MWVLWRKMVRLLGDSLSCFAISKATLLGNYMNSEKKGDIILQGLCNSYVHGILRVHYISTAFNHDWYIDCVTVKLGGDGSIVSMSIVLYCEWWGISLQYLYIMSLCPAIEFNNSWKSYCGHIRVTYTTGVATCNPSFKYLHQRKYVPTSRPGGWFNIKLPSYRYKKSYSGDKILRPFYLHNVISHTDTMTSLYWIRVQVTHIYISELGHH